MKSAIYVVSMCFILTGCNLKTHNLRTVPLHEAVCMKDIIEISLYSSEGYDEHVGPIPLNPEIKCRITNPKYISDILQAFQNVESGGYTTSCLNQICFRNSQGLIRCIDMDIHPEEKEIIGGGFFERTGKLYDAFNRAGAIPQLKKTPKVPPAINYP